MNGKILTRGRCVALTHNLTQNRKNAMETMEQRGLESISHRAEKLLKMLKTVKPYLGAQPHNPEIAGSSPVSATRKRGQKRFLVKKLRDFKTSEALG